MTRKFPQAAPLHFSLYTNLGCVSKFTASIENLYYLCDMNYTIFSTSSTSRIYIGTQTLLIQLEITSLIECFFIGHNLTGNIMNNSILRTITFSGRKIRFDVYIWMQSGTYVLNCTTVLSRIIGYHCVAESNCIITMNKKAQTKIKISVILYKITNYDYILAVNYPNWVILLNSFMFIVLRNNSITQKKRKEKKNQ